MIHIERRVLILRDLLTVVAVSPLAAGGCVLGVALSAIAVLQRENGSLGKNTITMTGIVACIPSSLFASFVRIININAPFEAQRAALVVPSAQPGPSFCYHRTSHKLLTAAIDCYQLAHPLNKYVFSRALFALSGITAIITRTADLALGLVAATFAIITLGTVKKLNDFAYNNLTFLLSIQDVVVAVRGLINPAVSQHLLVPPVLPPASTPPAPALVATPSYTPPAPKKEKKKIPADPLNFVAYNFIPEMLLDDCVLKKYECATSFELVRDPVRDPTGGNYIYERSEVEKWLIDHDLSPSTSAPLTVSELIEMPALKALINSRLQLHTGSLREGLMFDINAKPDTALQKAADVEYIPD
jgi:hypothetical protein